MRQSTEILAINAIEKLIPQRYHLPVRFQYRRLTGALEAEMFFIDNMLQQRRRFIDIGANLGMYSFYFCSRFQRVEAFEPLQELAYRLRALGKRSIETHAVALSNISGRRTFFLPVRNGRPVTALASLDSRQGACEERVVEVKKLDDYGFTEVDLIKIDVEGHEDGVLEGSVATIEKNKPLLLVEIEQRHSEEPIDHVFQRILSLGYEGYFLRQGRLINLDEFSYAAHQEPYLANVLDGGYVNNFIFKPSAG